MYKGHSKSLYTRTVNYSIVHHILLLFSVVSCNWNALGVAFLQSSDSIVEELLILLFQPSIWSTDNVFHIKLAPLHGGTGSPYNTWFLMPTWIHIPNGISIGSAFFLFGKDSPRHRITSCVQISWNLAHQKSAKSCVVYLTKKNKTSARSPAVASARITPKICQGQLQTIYSESPKFHPNPFTSGGVIAERVNIVETRHKVFPILGGASSPSNKWSKQSDKRPHRRCTWMVQWYLPGCASVHPT